VSGRVTSSAVCMKPHCAPIHFCTAPQYPVQWSVRPLFDMHTHPELTTGAT
jgi:hypothetical protein